MMKQRFTELTEKYLAGTATESERKVVEAYLAALEESNGLNFDLEKEEELKAEMWAQIRLQTIDEEVPVVQLPWYRRRVVRIIAIAASIACLIGLGLVFTNGDKPAEQAIATRTPKLADSILSQVHHIVNTTGKDENILLPDNSLIVLAKNSEISYRERFVQDRDVVLTGKAYFKVAKDKLHPFTVSSGAIVTTALGTEFIVTAFAKARQLTVRLYEGKVVIKAVDKSNKKLKKEVYLLPGQEFIYSEQALAKVNHFKQQSTTIAQRLNEDFFPDKPALPQDVTGNWYMFNNQSLEKVLDNLAALYHQKIIYQKQDVQRIYFTGKYNRTESLETILVRIGTLNNLKINKTDTAYIITR